MNLNNLPEFIDLEQVSDGWIKKYILHYRKPDGTPYSYESSSRKSLALKINLSLVLHQQIPMFQLLHAMPFVWFLNFQMDLIL